MDVGTNGTTRLLIPSNSSTLGMKDEKGKAPVDVVEHVKELEAIDIFP